jgi:hypothetical protein
MSTILIIALSAGLIAQTAYNYSLHKRVNKLEDGSDHLSSRIHETNSIIFDHFADETLRHDELRSFTLSHNTKPVACDL